MKRNLTSSGVVKAAEIPPPMEPHRADWMGDTSLPCHRDHCFFEVSYIGNWMNENGISRETVAVYTIACTHDDMAGTSDVRRDSFRNVELDGTRYSM